MLKLEELHNYLKLLLNPNEKKSQKILTSCNDIMQFFYFVKDANPPLSQMSSTEWSSLETKLFKYQEKLTENTQDALKEEWERVKKGV